MHSAHDYSAIVERVATNIREMLKNRVILVVPPDPLRGDIVAKLMGVIHLRFYET